MALSHLEPVARPISGLGRILSELSLVNLSNAVIAFLFAASAPVAIILGVGLKGGLGETDLASWIFGGFAINGLLTIVVSILYRQPLAFFWTIPGTVLVGPALQHLSFPEVIGAFYATGVLLLVLGLSGWVKKIMAALPMPIVMAMVAGVFLQFGLGWIKALGQAPWIAVPMTAVFVLLSVDGRVARRFPPMIGVLAVGIAAVIFTGAFHPAADFHYAFTLPGTFRPAFSWAAMVELVLPLAVTVLAAQNAQGIAILRNARHNPPVNTITAACGAVSLITAIVGSVSTCLTGPVNAILASDGHAERQYTGAVAIGILAILFGFHSLLFTKFLLAMPAAFIATLAGLALVRVLQAAFTVSFGGGFTLGALVSFLVTLNGQTLFNIGAPFWGLVFGFAVSWLLERKDFEAGSP